MRWSVGWCWVVGVVVGWLVVGCLVRCLGLGWGLGGVWWRWGVVVGGWRLGGWMWWWVGWGCGWWGWGVGLWWGVVWCWVVGGLVGWLVVGSVWRVLGPGWG